MEKTPKRSDCPISFGLDIFGDKWSLLIVRDLAGVGKSTYGAFLKSNEGIATNVLASRLRTLEAEGIIKKTPNPTDKRQEYYSLTKKGLDLLPILKEMTLWGAKHSPPGMVSKELVSQVKKISRNLTKGVQTNIR